MVGCERLVNVSPTDTPSGSDALPLTDNRDKNNLTCDLPEARLGEKIWAHPRLLNYTNI